MYSKRSGYERLNSPDEQMSPHEEQWLLDPTDEENPQLNGSTLPINSKIVTSPPIASSFPFPIKLSSTPNYRDDEESQLLLPNSIPFCDSPTTANTTTNNNFNNNSSVQSSPVRIRNHRSRSIMSIDLKSINETVSKFTQTLTRWTSSSKIDGLPNQIQYSVFKPVSSFQPITTLPNEGFSNQGPTSQAEFNAIVDDSITAIESGKKPKRIAAGSSGSYFIYNSNSEIVGVFKPKDEEPYGPLSPKWTKWLHRNLFPCFFGRSCLIPNLGYICESAASLLDRQLQSYIVPFTDVVSISSDRFYYSYWDRTSLPPKIGSYQLFLNDYMEADKFLEAYPLPGSKWSVPALYYTATNQPVPPLTRSNTELSQSSLSNPEGGIDLDEVPEFKWTSEVLKQFREELEKLVILDYILRNTDRGLDNWMINLSWETSSNGTKHPKLKIGAIDSGLSFPWKHPDEWRSYPFGWLFLPVSVIGQPFSKETREHYLPLLTSTVWWEECAVLFRELFAKDSDFKERMWKKQWAVMKGQAFNVVETLKNPTHGPLELARRTRILVHDEIMEVPVHIPVASMTNAMETPISNHIRSSTKLGTSANTLESIQENNDEVVKNPFHDDAELATQEESEEYQRNWNNLLKGNIKEDDLTPKKKKNSIHSTYSINPASGTSNITEEPNLIDSDPSTATKLVIIERIQAVNSKPPVFTWC